MNGWKNYETWNVTLWLGNDENLYALAMRFSERGGTYAELAETIKYNWGMPTTPDGIAWDDSAIDMVSVNNFLRNLHI